MKQQIKDLTFNQLADILGSKLKGEKYRAVLLSDDVDLRVGIKKNCCEVSRWEEFTGTIKEIVAVVQTKWIPMLLEHNKRLTNTFRVYQTGLLRKRLNVDLGIEQETVFAGSYFYVKLELI
jgi:hypothetical protein